MNKYARRAWRLVLNTDSPKYTCMDIGKFLRTSATTPSVSSGDGNNITPMSSQTMMQRTLAATKKNSKTRDGGKPRSVEPAVFFGQRYPSESSTFRTSRGHTSERPTTVNHSPGF